MTDAELGARFNALEKLITDLHSSLAGEMGTLRAQMQTREQAEAMETRLLSAFHAWAQTYEVRARGTSLAVSQFDERLGLIEERLSAVERRLRNGQ